MLLLIWTELTRDEVKGKSVRDVLTYLSSNDEVGVTPIDVTKAELRLPVCKYSIDDMEYNRAHFGEVTPDMFQKEWEGMREQAALNKLAEARVRDAFLVAQASIDARYFPPPTIEPLVK